MPSAVHDSLPLDPSKKEIRLLRIHPRRWEDEIYMDLYVVSLNDDPEYSALSYVWGQPDPKTERRAWVNGHTIPIAANLFLALRRLRAHAGQASLVIWIDALCIDQSTVDERNQQVAMMGEIYRGCKEGLVWFGMMEARLGWEVRDFWYFAGDDSDFAGEMWTRFLSCFGAEDFDPEIPDDGSDWESAHVPIDSTRVAGLQDLDMGESFFHFAWFLRQQQPRGSLARPDEFWRALPHNLGAPLQKVEGDWRGYWSRTRDFLGLIASDPWFRRLWVVQELALPRAVRVFFGPISMPIKTFQWATRSIPSTNVLSWETDKSLEDLGLLNTINRHHDEIVLLRRRHETKRTSIVDLRFSTMHRDASVDHDQAYSVLGMSSSALKPNYRDSPAATYTQVCRETILKERNLMPLPFAGVKNRHQNVPSGVVDWTMLQTDPRRRTWYEMWHAYLVFDATFEAAAVQTNPVVEENVLCVDGSEVDSVKEFLPMRFSSSGNVSRPDNGGPRNVYGEAARYLACPRAPTDPYAGVWMWGEVWLRTLCLDLEWVTSGATQLTERLMDDGMKGLLWFSGYENMEVKRHAFFRTDPELMKNIACVRGHTSSRTETSTDLRGWPTLRAQWEALSDSVEARMFERRLFVTEKGFLGCGNENVAVGDKVFLLPGTTVPIILRPLKEGGTETADHFRLVSDAFALGLMDMEAWLGILEHLRRIRIL